MRILNIKTLRGMKLNNHEPIYITLCFWIYNLNRQCYQWTSENISVFTCRYWSYVRIAFKVLRPCAWTLRLYCIWAFPTTSSAIQMNINTSPVNIGNIPCWIRCGVRVAIHGIINCTWVILYKYLPFHGMMCSTIVLLLLRFQKILADIYKLIDRIQ